MTTFPAFQPEHPPRSSRKFTSRYPESVERSTPHNQPLPRHLQEEDTETYFSLRPVSSFLPAAPESSSAALMRARARADALHRAVSSSSSKPAFDYARVESSSTSSRSAFLERFPAPPSLSVFNAPTATYMWPNFQASSQMKHDPILYARYNHVSSQSDSEDSADDGRRLSSPTSGHRETDEQYKPSFERPRIHKSPINRPVDPLQGVYIHPDRRSSPESSASSDCGRRKFDIDPPPRQDNRSFGALFEQNTHTPGFRRQSPSATSTASDQMSPLSSRPDMQNQLPPAPVPSQNWEHHAIQIKNPEGGVAYQCIWATPDGPCNYWSKKQLVKRHIETTHLKFKPFVCDICSKAFPQKTSLDIHHHGHTGDTPHHCNFNCGMSFKDPARRHRHHVEIHGYVPKQGKRKNQGSATHMQEKSPYESLSPLG